MVRRKLLEPALLGMILLAIISLALYPYVRGRKSVSSETSGKQLSASTKDLRDEQYSKDITELRDRFNHDKGKVRLLLLLSPT